MRKMKKINGYLVVRFNARELRENEGTALGNFGVIDAELYTGNLDVDRSVMEYDSAGTIEEAVEQARGLNTEKDYSEQPTTCAVIEEAGEDVVEHMTVEPQAMIDGWTRRIGRQVNNAHYPGITPSMARHELHGYKAALFELGLLEYEECVVLPDAFESEGQQAHDALPPLSGTTSRYAFKHLDVSGDLEKRIYELGLRLEEDCPQNDCSIYLYFFNMCRELDAQIDCVEGYPKNLLERELKRQYLQLKSMFMLNYAIRKFRQSCLKTAFFQDTKEPVISQITPCEKPPVQTARD